MLNTFSRTQIFALRVFDRLPMRLKQHIVGTIMTQALGPHLNNGDFAFLEDKVIAVEITDAKIVFFFSLLNSSIVMLDQQQEHVRFKGDLLSYINMLAKTVDPDSLFFQRKLTITGDTELGLTLKNQLDAIEVENLPIWFKKPISFYQKLYDMSSTKLAIPTK